MGPIPVIKNLIEKTYIKHLAEINSRSMTKNMKGAKDVKYNETMFSSGALAYNLSHNKVLNNTENDPVSVYHQPNEIFETDRLNSDIGLY